LAAVEANAIPMALNGRGVSIINLNDLEISQYYYEYRNESGDFLPLARKILYSDTEVIDIRIC
jgi:hypothetical protein